jgi:hypothetical protein
MAWEAKFVQSCLYRRYAGLYFSQYFSAYQMMFWSMPEAGAVTAAGAPSLPAALEAVVRSAGFSVDAHRRGRAA